MGHCRASVRAQTQPNPLAATAPSSAPPGHVGEMLACGACPSTGATRQGTAQTGAERSRGRICPRSRALLLPWRGWAAAPTWGLIDGTASLI